MSCPHSINSLFNDDHISQNYTFLERKAFQFKETKSATMNIFRNFLFSFKSFVKVELSYVFTINLFTRAENCTEK